jgi:hypothetical protein
MAAQHAHEPFEPATILPLDLLRSLPPTEEEFPVGDPVWPPSEEGNEPDRAGEFGPMAVETADFIAREAERMMRG